MLRVWTVASTPGRTCGEWMQVATARIAAWSGSAGQRPIHTTTPHKDVPVGLISTRALGSVVCVGRSALAPCRSGPPRFTHASFVTFVIRPTAQFPQDGGDVVFHRLLGEEQLLAEIG